MNRPRSRYEQEFLELLSRLDRAGRNLEYSFGLVSQVFPLDSRSYRGLERRALHDLDGLAERYSRYQDLLGPTFRTLALLEQEPRALESFLSLLALMERRGIVLDLDSWAIERELRNTASHGYLDAEEEWLEFYTLLMTQTPHVLKYRDRLVQYAKSSLGLKIPE